jgi:hypothetical protein
MLCRCYRWNIGHFVYRKVFFIQFLQPKDCNLLSSNKKQFKKKFIHFFSPEHLNLCNFIYSLKPTFHGMISLFPCVQCSIELHTMTKINKFIVIKFAFCNASELACKCDLFSYKQNSDTVETRFLFYSWIFICYLLETICSLHSRSLRRVDSFF